MVELKNVQPIGPTDRDELPSGSSLVPMLFAGLGLTIVGVIVALWLV